MARKISQPRKATYYIGAGLIVVGALSFCSVFVTFAINFGDFSNFDAEARSSMYRAFGGLFLIVVGSIVRSIGARGLAGSGVVLDPEQARDELEPYSRMVGGMAKDALDEAGVDLGGGSEPPAQVVMIKCRACHKLNEEDSKFCQECGKPI